MEGTGRGNGRDRSREWRGQVEGMEGTCRENGGQIERKEEVE